MSSSETKRQDVMFKLSPLFDCKPFVFIHLFTFNSLCENDSLGLFTKVCFDLFIAYRYVVGFFQIWRQDYNFSSGSCCFNPCFLQECYQDSRVFLLASIRISSISVEFLKLKLST